MKITIEFTKEELKELLNIFIVKTLCANVEKNDLMLAKKIENGLNASEKGGENGKRKNGFD